MILLIDNYDSFTYNLVQVLAALGAEVVVRRNDALTCEQALNLGASALVISPGPGRPKDAGITLELLAALDCSIPVLGVCLGHQALVEQAGGKLLVDPSPVHGKASLVHHAKGPLFRGIQSPFPCARYHSLVAERASLPEHLNLIAWTEEGHVMAVQDTRGPRFGVQFHPESILTPLGTRILANFLAAAGEPVATRSPGSSL
ncbi:MAG TPA: aminodeoxychorismate/anthranilate synthase component II [Planctomycetes bacterium]|nr:aminodeoxychorismate/anthranilate synthase component II [Planctomycetota bacterium]HIL37381.1 aminodeoxychorismate/anthranilate synthase component II [Planctomycetota bacterium]